MLWNLCNTKSVQCMYTKSLARVHTLEIYWPLVPSTGFPPFRYLNLGFFFIKVIKRRHSHLFMHQLFIFFSCVVAVSYLFQLDTKWLFKQKLWNIRIFLCFTTYLKSLYVLPEFRLNLPMDCYIQSPLNTKSLCRYDIQSLRKCMTWWEEGKWVGVLRWRRPGVFS